MYDIFLVAHALMLWGYHVVGSQDSCVSHGGSIQSWTLSDASLSAAGHSTYVSYNASYTPDIIWVFGGGGCATCVEYYNITDDTITTYDTLHTSSYTLGRPGSAQIGGLIYYLSSSEIHTYEIGVKDVRIFGM